MAKSKFIFLLILPTLLLCNDTFETGVECFGVICPNGTDTCRKNKETNLDETTVTVACVNSFFKTIYEHVSIEKNSYKQYNRVKRCYGMRCPVGTIHCKQLRNIYNATTKQAIIKCLDSNRYLIREFVYNDPIDPKKYMLNVTSVESG